MDLVDGKAGPVDYDLELVGANLKLVVGSQAEGVSASLVVLVEPGHFLDKLKALIPGKIDDAVIDVLKAAFLSKEESKSEEPKA